MAGMISGGGLDHYSYLIDRRHRPLLIGIFVLLFPVAATLTGQSLERFGKMVTRAESPNRFWWNVAFFYAAGLLGIGIFLYQNSN
jgi:hypothetical protein